MPGGVGDRQREVVAGQATEVLALPAHSLGRGGVELAHAVPLAQAERLLLRRRGLHLLVRLVLPRLARLVPAAELTGVQPGGIAPQPGSVAGRDVERGLPGREDDVRGVEEVTQRRAELGVQEPALLGGGAADGGVEVDVDDVAVEPHAPDRGQLRARHRPRRDRGSEPGGRTPQESGDHEHRGGHGVGVEVGEPAHVGHQPAAGGVGEVERERPEAAEELLVGEHEPGTGGDPVDPPLPVLVRGEVVRAVEGRRLGARGARPGQGHQAAAVDVGDDLAGHPHDRDVAWPGGGPAPDVGRHSPARGPLPHQRHLRRLVEDDDRRVRLPRGLGRGEELAGHLVVLVHVLAGT
jgi:hypothetical protein